MLVDLFCSLLHAAVGGDISRKRIKQRDAAFRFKAAQAFDGSAVLRERAFVLQERGQEAENAQRFVM